MAGGQIGNSLNYRLLFNCICFIGFENVNLLGRIKIVQGIGTQVYVCYTDECMGGGVVGEAC